MLICTIAFQVNAQENRNQTYNITLGNVQYAHHDEKMSAGEAIGKVLTRLATGQVSVQATKYEGDVKNAIIKGLSGAYRFHYNDGLQTGELAEEGNIVADAIITNIQAKSNTQTWKDTKGKIQTSNLLYGHCRGHAHAEGCEDGKVYDELNGQIDYSFKFDKNGLVPQEGYNTRLITVTPEQRQQLVEAYHKYLKKAKK